ncbi:hypothetical protein XA68_13369 [Ophiocordyceps unilateralis]|uniref:Uncharacterized protein n=1 Tax=Ophiocordyceps unilateralis TaxID=268505 RepID=A0A2A9PNK1_OPHUN|nr:hypothetical protein XA68_13369 [Ophiocordyceps unilateralis]
MRAFLAILVSFLAGSVSSLVQEAEGHRNARDCPTVTSTQSICSTCIRPLCVMQKTVTCKGGCSTPLPTVYKSYPCGSGCPGGCGTFYTYQGCGKPTPAPRL